MRVAVLLLVAIFVVAAVGEPQLQGMRELVEWVVASGGKVNGDSKYNKHGFRGLFATKSIKEGEPILTIPAACSINTGSVSGSFLTPALVVLRELRHPASPYRPYLDIFPKPHELVTACNLDPKYLPLLPPQLVAQVRSWQGYLAEALRGSNNLQLEYTVAEVLGGSGSNASLTLDELKYGCAVSSTRYVSSLERKRLMMFPVFDLLNHRQHCPHTLAQYDEGDEMQLVAGEDVEAGEELCYNYGSMRDDYSVMHYGFVPELQDPPRLLEIDHHQYNASKSNQAELSEERFSGTVAELRAELTRQRGTLTALAKVEEEQASSTGRLPTGQDPVYEMLLELQGRRLNALRYEVQRLEAYLRKSEL
ncbi:hypothetical protein V8C86DRAFT_506327 [Haematococcus lacustris]